MIDTTIVTTVILTCFTIFLSVMFFYLSYKSSKSIEISVDKLNDIYRIFTSQTLAMIEKTLADYREHAWAGRLSETDFSDQVEQKTNEKIQNIKEEVSEELEEKFSKLLQQKEDKPIDYHQLKATMEEIISRAVDESRESQEKAYEDFLKHRILGKLQVLPSEFLISYIDLYNEIAPMSHQTFITALSELQNENQIQLMPPVRGKQEIELNRESIFIKEKRFKVKHI